LDAQPWQHAFAIAPILEIDDFDAAQILHPMKIFRFTHHFIYFAVIAGLIDVSAEIDIRAGVTDRVVTGLEWGPRQQRAERKAHRQEKCEQGQHADKYPSLLQPHRFSSPGHYRTTTSTRCASVKSGGSHRASKRLMTSAGALNSRARFCSANRPAPAST